MNEFLTFFSDNRLMLLDIISTVVGLIYLYLEFKANIWLWLVSIIMPLIDTVLYFEAGLYADFGMAIYYALAAVYGYATWRFGKKKDSSATSDMPITHFPLRYLLPSAIVFLAAWAAIYLILIYFTDSTVPVIDSFVNALSIIGLWALARKYAEQWLVWVAVDAVCCGLYAYKGIPFKAGLYGIYTVVAVFGYFKWKAMMNENKQDKKPCTTR